MRKINISKTKVGSKLNTSKAKVGKFAKKQKKMLILAMLIIGTVITVFLVGRYIGLWAAQPTSGTATVKVLDIGDDNEDVSDKAKVTVYDVDISEMSKDELMGLDYEDYDILVEETYAEEISYYIDENHNYKMKVEFGDSVRWFNPEPGENVVMMVEKAASMTMIMEDDTTHSQVYEGNTVLGYSLRCICNEDDVGLMPGYMFDDDNLKLIWICLNYSRAAQEDFTGIENYYNEKVTSGTELYIGVTGVIVGETIYDIVFGTGKVSTYDVNNIGWDFGVTADNPTWMN